VDQKKLRDTLGLFTTGVIVACARRRNFLADKISSRANLFDNKAFTEKLFNSKIFGQTLKEIFTEEFFGMTINSFSSVSLHPPLVSFCIDNRSTNLNLFKKNRFFSLNILNEEQIDLAQGFATPKNTKKWQIEPYFLGNHGSPIFENSLGFFECKKHRIIKAGDHHIVIGQIVDFAKIQNKNPLLYNQSKFCTLEKDIASVPPLLNKEGDIVPPLPQ
jgi:flavin reductase (DIM6/NTAB) family NADH-FMN oxidoreductase RutF